MSCFSNRRYEWLAALHMLDCSSEDLTELPSYSLVDVLDQPEPFKMILQINDLAKIVRCILSSNVLADVCMDSNYKVLGFLGCYSCTHSIFSASVLMEANKNSNSLKAIPNKCNYFGPFLLKCHDLLVKSLRDPRPCCSSWIC